MAAAVGAVVLALSALQPEKGRFAMGDGIERAGPGLACPGCGSPDVDLRRGLLCGTCAEAAAPAGGGSDG
jgi:hypothetical protein